MQLYSIDLEFDGFVSSCTVYMHNAPFIYCVFNQSVSCFESLVLLFVCSYNAAFI